MGCGGSSGRYAVFAPGEQLPVEARDVSGEYSQYSGSDAGTPPGTPPAGALILGAELQLQADRSRGCEDLDRDQGVKEQHSKGSQGQKPQQKRRAPSGRRRREPVQWEQLADRQMAQENRKLRGDLDQLEKQMRELREAVDAQLEFKDQQLTDAHKKLAMHRIGSGAASRPHGEAPTAATAAIRIAVTDGTGGPGALVDAAVDRTWIQAKSDLNEDLRHYASLGEIGALQHALLRGADIDDVDDEGNTALLVATRKNQVDSVAELLRNGADYSVQNRFNMNAMTLAVRGGFAGVIELLRQQGCPLHLPNGFSALFEAVRLGHADIVNSLLQDPAVLVDEVNLIQETPLVVAARAGHEEVARTLILHSADIEHRAMHDVTPLMAAAEVGATSIATLLLNKNAKVNAQDDKAMTALHYATRHNHLDVVRLLLEFGATAFSNRHFQQKRLFDAPAWGPASIRRISKRPATAPTHNGHRQGLGESFSSASRVPPVPLKVDDLGLMSRWSTEISGALMFGHPGLSGAVPSVLESFPSRPQSAALLQRTWDASAESVETAADKSPKPNTGSRGSKVGTGSRNRPASAAAAQPSRFGQELSGNSGQHHQQHLRRPVSAASSIASVGSSYADQLPRDVIERGQVTIMKKSVGGADYQQAKLKLLGLVT